MQIAIGLRSGLVNLILSENHPILQEEDGIHHAATLDSLSFKTVQKTLYTIEIKAIPLNMSGVHTLTHLFFKEHHREYIK